MLINSDLYVTGFLHLGYRPDHIHQCAVRMGASHRQTARPGERDNRLVILLGRTKHIRELCRRQILMVAGTGRVVNLLEQVAEGLRVAQRQANCQVQMIRGRQPPNRLRMHR